MQRYCGNNDNNNNNGCCSSSNNANCNINNKNNNNNGCCSSSNNENNNRNSNNNNNNGCCSSSNNENNNRNSNNNNNNFIENYDLFVSPITNENIFIINQFLNKDIKDLINSEVDHFYHLKNRIRQIIPKENNLIQLLISEGETLPDDPSKIKFIYRVIISKNESSEVFCYNYSRMKLILNQLKGIVGIFRENDNDNEIILGFADLGNNPCEFVLLAICKLIQLLYNNVESFDKKNYVKPQVKNKTPFHDDEENPQTYNREYYESDDFQGEEHDNMVYQFKLLVQEEKAMMLNGMNYDQIDKIANASGIKLKLFNTRFPNSNEYLLIGEGVFSRLRNFFYYTSFIFRKEERVKLMNYIPTSKYYLDFQGIQEKFLEK